MLADKDQDQTQMWLRSHDCGGGCLGTQPLLAWRVTKVAKNRVHDTHHFRIRTSSALFVSSASRGFDSRNESKYESLALDYACMTAVDSVALLSWFGSEGLVLFHDDDDR